MSSTIKLEKLKMSGQISYLGQVCKQLASLSLITYYRGDEL